MIHPGYEVVRISPLASWVTWSLAGWPRQSDDVVFLMISVCAPTMTAPFSVDVLQPDRTRDTDRFSGAPWICHGGVARDKSRDKSGRRIRFDGPCMRRV